LQSVPYAPTPLSLLKGRLIQPLPGTIKNNMLELISILFPEVLPHRRKGWCGGER